MKEYKDQMMGSWETEPFEADIRCNLDWTGKNPKLIFTFSQDIHPENIIELSRVIELTIQKKINCMVCSTSDFCDKKIN